MEMPPVNWLQELDTEEFTLIHQPEMGQAPEQLSKPKLMTSVGGDDFEECSLSIEDYAPWSISQGSCVPQDERWSSCNNQHEAFLSFGGNLGSSDDGLELYRSPTGGAVEASNELVGITTRSINVRRFDRVTMDEHEKSKQHCPQDHAIAERKRRERLNQHFIALSAIIPGVKKIDKATLLRDAISYVKELEEKVKTLEENVEETIKPLIFFKKSCHPIDNNTLNDFDEPTYAKSKN